MGTLGGQIILLLNRKPLGQIMKRNSTILLSTFMLSTALVLSSMMISNAANTSLKGCSSKKTGILRLISNSSKCKKTEKTISLNSGTPDTKPVVTSFDTFDGSWQSIARETTSWDDSAQVAASGTLAAGKYLVHTTMEAYGHSMGWCGTVADADHIGAGGTYHTFTGAASGAFNLSYSNVITVPASGRLYVLCNSVDESAEVNNVEVILVPVK